MSRNRLVGVAASASLLLALFVVLPGIGADEKDKSARESLYRPLGLFTEVLSLVRSNYVEPVEARSLLEGAFSGMTEAMDPFSEYVPPEKMAALDELPGGAVEGASGARHRPRAPDELPVRGGADRRQPGRWRSG